MPGGSTSPQNAGLSAPLRGQGSFSFMSAGNRETSVNMMLNGINLNDLSNSQVTFQPSINTVSEFKVDNSTFSAEYGRNSGAIVNVATRSGANQMHGEAFDFYRDDQFDSRNYFNPAEHRHVGQYHAAIAVQPEAVRRQPRRSRGEEPVVLLRQLRRASPRAGRRPEFRHADRRATRRRHRSDGEESAPVHPEGQRPDRYARDQLAAGAGHHRSIHDRFTQQPAAERRPPFLLRVPEGLPPGVERAGTDCAGLPGPARRTPPDHDGQRDAHLQLGAGERSARRIQPDQHHASSRRRSSTRTLSASTSAKRPCRSRCRRSRFPVRA